LSSRLVNSYTWENGITFKHQSAKKVSLRRVLGAQGVLGLVVGGAKDFLA